jgi:hypothetical protein
MRDIIWPLVLILKSLYLEMKLEMNTPMNNEDDVVE